MPDTILGRWRRLPPAERRVAGRAVLGLVAIRAALARHGVGAAVQAVSRTRARTSRPPLRPARLVWLVEATAARLPWHTSCLERSLVAARLLAEAGHAGTLVIGVGESRRPLAAHAWIESGRQALGPALPPAQTPVARWRFGTEAGA